jgi:hypothetical protein
MKKAGRRRGTRSVVRGLFPAIEPYEQGMLAVSDGNLVYWETCGNPLGKPALVAHGGLRAALPDSTADPDVVEGYHPLLHDPDPGVRQRAAVEWCRWESATLAWPPTTGLSPRFRGSRFALAFARLVTHYVRHNAWELSRVWPRAELVIVDDAGHAADAAISDQLMRASDRFAQSRTRTKGTKRPGSGAADAG